MTFNTFFLIRLLLLHRSESSYEPANVCIYQTVHEPSFFFCICVFVCSWSICVGAHMMCTHVTEDFVICCRPAKDFNLDLQLSQGHGAALRGKRICMHIGPTEEDSFGGYLNGGVRDV